MGAKLSSHLGGRTGSPLTNADYAALERRWIDKPLADAAKICRVDSITGHRLVGRRGSRDYAGLAIPNFLPGETVAREWRLHRDHPEIEIKDGKPIERGKYLSPLGRKNAIYFVPGTSQDLVKAVATPAVMTTGEFQTLALWRLAHHKSTDPRFLPLGLAGAWSWRGTIGKTAATDGVETDVVGVIPDFDQITWEGRRAIIAFDPDTDEHAETSRTQLTRELRARGAEVASVTWDAAHGRGIDDLLANIGPEKVLTLLEGADFAKEEPGDISIHKIAEAITAKHRFAQDAGGKLCVYRNGCYHPNGPSFIAQQVKTLLVLMKLAGKWTSHKSEEVVKYIAVDAPLLWEKPSLDRINVLNGLLDVNTRILSPHSADFLSPVQLPVRFDPAAVESGRCE